jgi:hypothetical protein
MVTGLRELKARTDTREERDSRLSSAKSSLIPESGDPIIFYARRDARFEKHRRIWARGFLSRAS